MKYECKEKIYDGFILLKGLKRREWEKMACAISFAQTILHYKNIGISCLVYFFVQSSLPNDKVNYIIW